jgi:TRAP-type mannitol/chloroaromatic compound transport system substrate-binding protein
VPALQVLDAAGSGTVEVGYTAPYYYVGKDPAMTFGTALPFGLNSRQMWSWLYHAGGRELLAPVMAHSPTPRPRAEAARAGSASSPGRLAWAPARPRL